MAKQLKIGELAKLAGISTDTLRFYEKNDLLQAHSRSQSGYRLYSNSELSRLKFIQHAKAVGFTLGEINELLQLDLRKQEAHCQEVKNLVDDKLATVNRRIQELKRMQSSLSLLSAACSGGDKKAIHCTILETLSDQEDDIQNGAQHESNH